MKNYELLDAVGGIDAEYVENAARERKSKRSSLWVKIVPAAACLCLILGAAVLFKPGTPNPPAGDNSGDLPSASEYDAAVPSPTDQTVDESPVYYSSLKLADSVLDEEMLALFKSNTLDVKAFDESMLSQDHCCMIIEGTVVNLYVKQYNYDVYSDKFEENGILHGRTDTLVYEVAVDKTWYGEDISGETVFVEDTSCFMDPVLAVKEGRRYVLPLYEYGETIWTGVHEYAGGDITRDSRYSTIYPYHPQIEVTNDGSYLVSQDWTTLTANNAKEVIMDTLDDDFWKDKMYLVDENTFSNQMAVLIDSILES